MTRTAFLRLVLAVVLPAAAANVATPANAGPKISTAATAPTVVARYTFDTGIAAGGIAEVSGRGSAAAVRSVDAGALAVATAGTNKYSRFPGKCTPGKPVCPRVILEAPDDADLDPGLRRFQWGASVRVLTDQLGSSSNIMQKGLYDTDSQWKMQIGPNHGKAQCVVVGQGSARSYVARSSSAIADGNWHKVLCERNGKRLTITVDGVPQSGVDLPANLVVDNNRPLRIGGPNFSNREALYHGWLDEVYASLG
jgi:hypothetical protein